MGRSRWYFSTIADELETDIRDLLAQEDVTSEDFAGIADAANNAMISTFAGDLQERQAIVA